MGAAYQIFGKTVQPHQLSIATLGLVTLLALPKPWGPTAPKHPAIDASSKEEETFVKEYMKKHGEQEKHH